MPANMEAIQTSGVRATQIRFAFSRNLRPDLS
jgi:hypothetical protein